MQRDQPAMRAFGAILAVLGMLSVGCLVAVVLVRHIGGA